MALLLAGALAARSQDPQQAYGQRLLAAARQGDPQLRELVREQPARAALLVRDVVRSAARTGDQKAFALLLEVAQALDTPLRDRLAAEVQRARDRDADQMAAANRFELLLEQAQHALQRGDGAAALGPGEEARSLADALREPYLQQRAGSLCGVARCLAGDLDRGVDELRAAVQQADALDAALESEHDRRALAAQHEARAQQRGTRGDYQGALDDLFASSRSWRDLRQPDQEGRVLVALGGAFAELARFADAETALQRALSIFAGQDAPRGRTMTALATCWLDQGRSAAALPVLQEACELAVRSGDRIGEAEACRLIGRTRLDDGDGQAAEPMLARALDLPGTRLTRALLWTSRGDAAVLTGELEAARAHYERALEHGAELAEGCWRARAGLGRLAEAASPATALEHYCAAVADLENLRCMLRLPELRERTLTERRRPYIGAARLLAQRGRQAEAFAMLELLQARTLWEAAAGPLARATRAAALTLLEGALAACEQSIAADSGDRTAWLSRRDELRAEHELLRVQSMVGGAGRAVLAGRAPAELASVREALEPAAALLLYGLDDQAGLCLVVRRDGVRSIELCSGVAQLAPRVDALLAPMRDLAAGRVDTGNLRFRVAEACALYDLLLRPLPLDGVGRLWIVADGPLRRLPFAMLVSKHEPRPVIPESPYAQYHGCRFAAEDFELAMLPAASLLTKTAAANDAAASAALVVGCGLPGAVAEAGAVAAVLRTDAGEAAESSVVAALVRSTSVHIASHAELDAARPAYSRLRLLEDAASDGWLHAYEIGELVLPQPLVVLSGCDTAGHPGAGDGLLGLLRAFLSAGARAVVATQWPVADRASAELMADFHGRGGARDPVAALTAAQRAMLASGRRGRSAWSHPYFWAGYSVHGRP